MADYKIKLGIDFNDGELNNIKKQLTNLTDNTHRIRIDVDNSRLLKQIEHAKKELKELNSAKGNQPSLTVNTQSLEKSLSRVADVIEKVRKSLGTLDDKSGMKSLLSSVNQIATALGKVENESDSLLKSLSALSKKDFSINFDVNFGDANKALNPTAYGRKARKQIIPELDSQIEYLEKSIRQSLLDEAEAAQKAANNAIKKFKYPNGKNKTISLSAQDLLGLEISKDEDWNKAFADLDDSSYIKKMEAREKHIEKLIGLANTKGVNLDGFYSQFSKGATELIDDVAGLENAADKAEDINKKFKNLFGGSLDVEGLSGQLQPIITDLGEIKTAIQSLSSNNSIDGLTQSFNRLSETLEKLTANLTLAKNTLDTGFSNTAPANNAVKAAQQTGQKIGEAIGKSATQSAKQSINLDDVVEKETRALMKEYGISAKNNAAKDDIKGALTNYVNEIKNGGTIVNDELFGSFNTADAALRKVTDTIARHKKEVIELDTLYEDLLADIKSVNKGKGATKVRLSDMRAEWGDDYKANKDLLGSWFSDKYTDGIGIDSWVKSKSWSSLLDLSGSHQDIANQLVELVKKAKTKTAYSGDELFKEGFLNIDDVEASVKESAANISAAEQKMAQSSTAATDTIVRNQQRQQEAYEANLKAKKAEIEQEKKRLTEINKSIDGYNNRFLEASTTGDPNAMEYYAKMQSLEADGEALKAHIDALDVAYNKEVQQAQEAANAINQAEERKQQAYQETAKIISSIQKGSFQKAFSPADDDLGGMKNTAKSVEQYFKNLQGVIADTVSVQERFDTDGNLDGFTVSLKNANGEAEKLRYTFQAAADDGKAFFKYTGGSINDNDAAKQTEKSIKKANDLQIQLDKIKTGYSNLGASKPIKEEFHIQSLAEQYDTVQAAIENVKNADNVTFASMESNAKKEIATLESLVKVYRDAETFSTDLRAKDRDAAREVYSSRLDVLSSKMRKDGVYAGLETDVSDLKTKISGASDVKALSEIANELTKLDAKYKSAKAAKDEFNRSQNVGSSVSGLKSDIEILQQASPSIKSFKTEINGAEVSIESLLKDLDQVGTKGDFDVVKGKVEAFGKAAEASGIDLNEAKAEAKRVNDAYKQMLETQKQIRSLSIKEKNLTELGSTNELNEVSAKLKDLKADYGALKRTFGDKLTSAQFGTLQSEIDETESELKQLDAKWADTKAKLAKSIKIDIELGNFGNQMNAMRSSFNNLSNVNDDLRRSVEAVENAYREMLNAADINTGDEIADRRKLIQAEEQYAAALEKTNNLIKQQARADGIDNNSKALNLKAKGLSLDMDNWLKDNSAAAKQFGDAIRELKVRLESCNDVEFSNIKSEFQNIKKEAKSLGLTTKTVGDKLKQQFAQYSAYLGVAEMFMWVEQGLRSMYDAVVEIDTAMTGLYRVTDLTSAEYDSLFSNMIDSAKEYGATLNDIINATSDWVRAGFDANTALGLAEVTTMYQHISDLDYDTASENLITAYNGFKNELNGLFGGDEVAAVNYIADILNELDNNYAATSAGIGEALTRSASALDLAGNSIQETAG